MKLSGYPIKATLEDWSADHIPGRGDTAKGIMGRQISHNNGTTAMVVAVDKALHLVLTKTGTVYKLGTPNVKFAEKNQRLVEEVGFSK